MFTLCDLQEAWLHVEENAGIAGADGVTVEHFAHQAEREMQRLLAEVQSSAYRPLPLLELRIQKHPNRTETRTLMIPAVRDRILQTAVARSLSKAFEPQFLDASFAYRPGRSVDSAIARVTQLRDSGLNYVVHADIEAFFDNVRFDILIGLLAADSTAEEYLPLLRKWIHAMAWDGERIRRIRAGIPQGSPLSPLLSNVFLEPFDARLESRNYHLVRYADDMLVLCATAADADAALRTVRDSLAESALRLQTEKTRIETFDGGFDFLGAFFLRKSVYLPWKWKREKGQVVFLARPMPAGLVARYFEKCRPARASPVLQQRRPAHPGNAGGSAVAYLYLTEQGAILRKSGERLLVEREGRIALDLPYHKLEYVLVFGNVQVTSAAVAELLDKRIQLSWFTRNGRFLGALVPPSAKNVELRVVHFDRYRDPEASFTLARSIVTAKLANAREVLLRYQRRNPEVDAGKAIGQIEQAVSDLESMRNVNALDGLEGASARAYFDCLMRFNKSEFAWPGRLKHPAPDPINALLSLTYVLLTHELQGLLEGAGLDPYLGFLHQLDYGRPSLALDLVEAFRHPVADRFVLTLLNRRVLKTADFHHGPGAEGVVLDHDALQRFFGEYERWMIDGGYRTALRGDVQGLARHFRDNTPWRPFSFSGAADPEEACVSSSATT